MPTPLAERLRLQAAECARLGSPLYAGLLDRVAADLEAGGVTARVLAALQQLPGRSVPGLRLMGAVHRLVLQRRAPALAAFYPTAGGSGSPAAAWPAFRETLVKHAAEVGRLVDRPVQTNEVGRAAALYGGLLAAGVAVDDRGRTPVRLLEVGASGGLNLRVDHFAYVVSGQVLGEAASPVRLVEPWVGTPVPDPAVPVRVAERAGCDTDPVDVTSPEGRLTLASYVWADQVERLERLRAAFEVAARVPARVDRARAGEWLERALARPVPGRLTVVWHSVVWVYLDPSERARAEAAIAAAGRRAIETARLVRIGFESRREEGRFVFEVHLTSWPGAETHRLAVAEGHGPPVRWQPAI